MQVGYLHAKQCLLCKVTNVIGSWDRFVNTIIQVFSPNMQIYLVFLSPVPPGSLIQLAFQRSMKDFLISSIDTELDQLINSKRLLNLV